MVSPSLLAKYQLATKRVNFKPARQIDFDKLIDKSINRRVKTRLSNQQREFYLREKLNAIREELGEKDKRESDLEKYRQRLAKEPFPARIKERVYSEISRLQSLPPTSAERGVVKNYID